MCAPRRGQCQPLEGLSSKQRVQLPSYSTRGMVTVDEVVGGSELSIDMVTGTDAASPVMVGMPMSCRIVGNEGGLRRFSARRHRSSC